MNADQIKQIIESNFPEIRSKRLKYGWSFFYKEIVIGPNPSRIARVEQKSSNRKVDFKPSITARRKEDETIREEITDQESQICEIIRREIDLYLEYYANP